jgi:hypothetical protein
MELGCIRRDVVGGNSLPETPACGMCYLVSYFVEIGKGRFGRLKFMIATLVKCEHNITRVLLCSGNGLVHGNGAQ